MTIRRMINETKLALEKEMQEPPWYGTVCPVVWEDGESNLASYPIFYKLRPKS